MMGLSDGRKSFPIGLAVLIHYRSVTATQPPSHPASHVAVAITLNAKASSLKTAQCRSAAAETQSWQGTEKGCKIFCVRIPTVEICSTRKSESKVSKKNLAGVTIRYETVVHFVKSFFTVWYAVIRSFLLMTLRHSDGNERGHKIQWTWKLNCVHFSTNVAITLGTVREAHPIDH